MSMRTALYTVAASTGVFLGTYGMPSTVEAGDPMMPEADKKIEVTAGRKELEEEIKRARKIVEDMQKEGLPPKEIELRAKVLARVLASHSAKLQIGEKINMLTEKEQEEIAEEIAKQLMLSLLGGTGGVLIGIYAFGRIIKIRDIQLNKQLNKS